MLVGLGKASSRPFDFDLVFLSCSFIGLVTVRRHLQATDGLMAYAQYAPDLSVRSAFAL